MKKKYIVFFTLLMGILMFFLFKEIRILNKNNTKIENKTYNQTIFKNYLLENVVNKVEKTAVKNGLNIKDLSLVKYEDKTFFKLDILDIENSSYIIHYKGIDVTSLYANIGSVSEQNSDILEKIIITLIEVSDSSILEVEAKKIYLELVDQMKENTFNVKIQYKNNLFYNIEILDDGAVVFFIE